MSGRFEVPKDADTRLAGALVIGAVLLLVIFGRAFRDVPAG